MRVLSKLWWGGYSLPRAFWGFYVFGAIGSLFVAELMIVIAILLRASTIGFIAGVAIILGYLVIAAVGVWRSANTYLLAWKYPFRGARGAWVGLTKAVICAHLGWVAWKLMNGGALAVAQRMTARLDL